MPAMKLPVRTFARIEKQTSICNEKLEYCTCFVIRLKAIVAEKKHYLTTQKYNRQVTNIFLGNLKLLGFFKFFNLFLGCFHPYIFSKLYQMTHGDSREKKDFQIVLLYHSVFNLLYKFYNET